MNHSAIPSRAAIAAALCWPLLLTGGELTKPDRDHGLRHLDETRSALVKATGGLSEAQWSFKPAPDRWSVAETLEHIVLVEELFLQGIRKQLETAPDSPGGGRQKQADAAVVAKVLDRSVKSKAPPAISPSARWSPPAALARFHELRTKTINHLSSATELRQHVLDHPSLGPLDGYQWVLAVSAHAARHTEQILEVKAHPEFPRN